MRTDALKDFRKGLSAGEFTMTEIAEQTGIPLTTLSDMKDDDWCPKSLRHLAKLEDAMRAVSRRRAKGRAVA